MNKECSTCKFQTGCVDCWENNPNIPITGCCKYQKENNNDNI